MIAMIHVIARVPRALVEQAAVGGAGDQRDAHACAGSRGG